jgi:hypothetical protein
MRGGNKKRRQLKLRALRSPDSVRERSSDRVQRMIHTNSARLQVLPAGVRCSWYALRQTPTGLVLADERADGNSPLPTPLRQALCAWVTAEVSFAEAVGGVVRGGLR